MPLRELHNCPPLLVPMTTNTSTRAALVKNACPHQGPLDPLASEWDLLHKSFSYSLSMQICRIGTAYAVVANAFTPLVSLAYLVGAERRRQQPPYPLIGSNCLPRQDTPYSVSTPNFLTNLVFYAHLESLCKKRKGKEIRSSRSVSSTMSDKPCSMEPLEL